MAVLECKALTKNYGHVAALDGVETARYFAGLQADELIDILCEG